MSDVVVAMQLGDAPQTSRTRELPMRPQWRLPRMLHCMCVMSQRVRGLQIGARVTRLNEPTDSYSYSA